tara:strand:- start:1151 stop:1477 length:327 start_codon:yes stop_codon:yes gene_type:complete
MNRLLLCLILTPDAFIFDKLLSALRRFCEAKSTGALAQLGEHLLCKQGVIGSIPISSTKSFRASGHDVGAAGVCAASVESAKRTEKRYPCKKNTHCMCLRVHACSDTS